jgi:hypothetical protein
MAGRGGDPWAQFADAEATAVDEFAQFGDAPAVEPTAGQRLIASNPGEYDPNSPEFKAKYGPTSGMSNDDLFMAGAGKSVVDLGRGLRQIGTEIGERTGFIKPELSQLVTGQTRSQKLRAEQDEMSQRDAALMSTGNGVAGNITGTLATTLLPASLAARGAQAANLGRTAGTLNAFVNPTTYRAAAAAGAVQGALQPVGSNESRAQNALVGGGLGLAGNAAANAIGRVAQPVRQALSKEDSAAVKTLEKAGVSLDVAQRSGSKAAEVVKRAVDDNPFTGPGQKSFAETQRKQFTRAVLKTIGEDAEAATSDVMGAAKDRIGKVFDDVAERNPVKYDGQLHGDLTNVYTQASKELTAADSKVINNQLSEIFTKAQDGGGMIDGKAYQNIKSSLDRVIKDGGSKGHWAGELKETIEDALQRSASKDDLKALKEARTQYRRMKQIEVAIDTDGAGIISPAKLSNSLSTKANRAASIYGKGDRELVVLAQAGKKLLPDKFPNSGTAARLAGQLLAPTAIGLGAGYASGDPGTGIGTAIASAAALRGAQGAMNNQLLAKFLTNGMKQGAARTALTSPQRAGALTRQLPAVALPAFQE